MMSYWLSLFVFAGVCTALLVLALRPAWQEWLSPTDCEPLPVSANYTSEIDHFADEFRVIALSGMAGVSSQVNRRFELVPAAHADMNWKAAIRPLISLNSIDSTKSILCASPLFVRGDFASTAINRFSALFAQGTIRLGAGSEVVKWAHADDVMHLEAGCTALRRISSARAIELDRDCCFERIQAPIIRFGMGTPAVELPREKVNLITASLSNLDEAVHQSASLTLIRGDCSLPAGHSYRGSLVVTGRLYIGEDTEIVGDIKARGGLVVGARARVRGAVTSERQIQILENATIQGPVISETVILVGAHSRLGTPQLPTTVSAEHIIAEAGAVAHGTVWARDLGIVWST